MTDSLSTAEVIATACPIIRDRGWAFYFAPSTIARGVELGLDYLQFYAMGRGGVLGDVDSIVVHSAFGYFNPTLIDTMWTAGRAIIQPSVAAREYMQCCAEYGRDKLALLELDAFVVAADAVNAAADPTALTLYAALSTLPLADDTSARAMQLVTVLREFRGSAHLVALRAVGVDSKTAHFVARPADIGLFGWTDEDAPEVTDDTRRLMRDAEALTDRIVAPAYASLDLPGRAALLSGLQDIATALSSR